MFATAYPMSWGMKLELAKVYESIGINMSAYELMKSVGMKEEAIRFLF